MAEPVRVRTTSRPAAAAVRAAGVAVFVRTLAVAAVVVIADRITKHLVVSGIPVGDVRRVVPGVRLVHYRNSGVAFSFFAGGGGLVLALTLAAVIALTVYFIRHAGRRGLWIPTGLLIGGAVGNLIDRLASGSVTDFIKLPHWPAFNVADVAITGGVIVLLWVMEGPRRRSGSDGG